MRMRMRMRINEKNENENENKNGNGNENGNGNGIENENENEDEDEDEDENENENGMRMRMRITIRVRMLKNELQNKLLYHSSSKCVSPHFLQILSMENAINVTQVASMKSIYLWAQVVRNTPFFQVALHSAVFLA